MYKGLKPYTPAGFEPWIFCTGGRRDDHYATPPGQSGDSINIVVSLIIRIDPRPAIRSVTFSDVESSLAEKEAMLLMGSGGTAPSTTTSSTEYFSAISSDEDDDFFDVQTDTEREDDSESNQVELRPKLLHTLNCSKAPGLNPLAATFTTTTQALK
jgi:hypothetical protein